ncbi:hypothetical protein ABT354_12965 [Streptomyces sp. NPDC000594]|uniref:hypothetical protein n=1 Tax=Streptomyces sp. NPDC000594 TaxID=3154261 RepID=UPI00331F69DC
MPDRPRADHRTAAAPPLPPPPLPPPAPPPGPPGPERELPRADGIWSGRWQMDHDGWHGELVLDPLPGGGAGTAPDVPVRLGCYRRAGRRYAVHGFTVQHGRGLRFRVDQTQDQEFQAYLCGGDAARAAGWTDWRGTPFGLSLSRSARPGPPAQGFTAADWPGVWVMDHDGRRGRLDISSVRPFAAQYTPAQGRGALPAFGGPDGRRPHILDLTIPFPGGCRSLRLLAHTWERDVFSGHTSWGGLLSGVRGHRV